jgi:hypothetical protein
MSREAVFTRIILFSNHSMCKNPARSGKGGLARTWQPESRGNQYIEKLLRLLFQGFSGGEFYHFLGRDLDLFAGLRVSSCPGFAFCDREGAETCKVS